MRFLLDVNVLLGLAFPEDSSYQKAQAWFRREPHRLWATCALTQAGFVRNASRAMGGSRDAVQRALATVEEDCRSSDHEHWPVDVDLRDLSDAQRSRLIGHNQITDMQLLMLAHRHRGQLATFDTRLRVLAAGSRYANSLLVL